MSTDDSPRSSGDGIFVSTHKIIQEQGGCRKAKTLTENESTHLRGKCEKTQRKNCTKDVTIRVFCCCFCIVLFFCIPSRVRTDDFPFTWFFHLLLLGATLCFLLFVFSYLVPAERSWRQRHDGSSSSAMQMRL